MRRSARSSRRAGIVQVEGELPVGAGGPALLQDAHGESGMLAIDMEDPSRDGRTDGDTRPPARRGRLDRPLGSLDGPASSGRICNGGTSWARPRSFEGNGSASSPFPHESEPRSQLGDGAILPRQLAR